MTANIKFVKLKNPEQVGYLVTDLFEVIDAATKTFAVVQAILERGDVDKAKSLLALATKGTKHRLAEIFAVNGVTPEEEKLAVAAMTESMAPAGTKVH